MVWSCFSIAVFGPLIPVKLPLNFSAYRDILNNSMLPTLELDSSLTLHKAGSIKPVWCGCPHLNPQNTFERKLKA